MIVVGNGQVGKTSMCATEQTVLIQLPSQTVLSVGLLFTFRTFILYFRSLATHSADGLMQDHTFREGHFYK